MTDSELLAEYSHHHSQEAFAVLVERYMRLVHSACRRQLRDAQLAEDATQMVFTLLRQKSAKLHRTELSGWLLTSARYTCANLRRSEQRQRFHQQAVAIKDTNQIAEPNSELLEMLDEGLLRLGAADRSALVLRFFQNEPLREVGESLGLSEDTARKRVERALDKLRAFFQEREIQTDSTALATILTDHAHAAVSESLTHRIIHTCASPRVTALPVHPGALVAASVAISAIVSVGAWGVLRTPSKATIHASTPLVLATTSPITTFDRQRETAARIKCGANMVQIGRAMLDYAKKHNGNFPGDFGSLIITEEISPQLFVCPDSKTQVPPNLSNQNPEEQAIWVDRNSDYIYLGNGQRTGFPDNILAYEKDSDHVDGMTMLWGDGHVDYDQLAWAHQAIQRQLAAKK